jgi:RNA polymerase sigma factor (sigma-70 family)
MQSAERGHGQEARCRERLAELLGRARQNDKDAIVLLLEEFAPELFEIIRAHIPKQIRNAFDSTDFFQDVAVALVKLDVYPAFVSPDAFLAYAATMAKYTVLMEARKQLHTQKRDPHRQVSLRSVADTDEVVDKEISTLERIIQDDEWEAVLKSERPVYRAILQLRRDGLTQRQIAESLNLSERLVRSLLKSVIQRHASKNS